MACPCGGTNVRRDWEHLIGAPGHVVLAVSCLVCFRTLSEQHAVIIAAAPGTALQKRIARSP